MIELTYDLNLEKMAQDYLTRLGVAQPRGFNGGVFSHNANRTAEYVAALQAAGLPVYVAVC